MFLLSRHARLMSRGAMAMALACGLSALPMVAAPALAKDKKEAAGAAPKLNLTKPFQATALAFDKGLEEAKKRADVTAAAANVTAATNTYNAATTGSARKAAMAQRDAALAALGATLTVEKSLLEGMYAAITNPDEKFFTGTRAIGLGTLAQDVAIQRRGVTAMIESGKSAPADVPRLHYFVGQFAADMKDYAAARTSYQAALDGGYKENDVAISLAEAYFSDNLFPAGLEKLKAAIDARNATGTPAPENWYRRGLGMAYKAKLMDQAAAYSVALVKAYPTRDNWASTISVIRLVGKFQPQEAVDLMRLMKRTGSFGEASDYAEFIQAADPRRLPAEVLTVIDAGVAAGKLSMSDLFVSEAKNQATARVTAERPTLPALEKSALAPAATGLSIAATADALLSYGEAAKAENLFALALQKGGSDEARSLTRLGIAQVDQGKYAEAQATFAKITGVRQPIAQLWSIFAAQKAKGG